jgi:hypothetical protein
MHAGAGPLLFYGLSAGWEGMIGGEPKIAMGLGGGGYRIEGA